MQNKNGVDTVSLSVSECTWCKRADGVCFAEGLSRAAVSSSRVRQQLQHTSPLTGTVQQLPAALTQGLEETERGLKEDTVRLQLMIISVINLSADYFLILINSLIV